MALTVGQVMQTPHQEASIRALATRVRELQGPADAPRPAGPSRAGPAAQASARTTSGRPLPVLGDGTERYIDAVTDAVRDLDGSYLGVQGPPGTGKTHLASRVIGRLVAEGWRVGWSPSRTTSWRTSSRASSPRAACPRTGWARRPPGSREGTSRPSVATSDTPCPTTSRPLPSRGIPARALASRGLPADRGLRRRGALRRRRDGVGLRARRTLRRRGARPARRRRGRAVLPREHGRGVAVCSAAPAARGPQQLPRSRRGSIPSPSTSRPWGG
ncbi:hypothetical protein NKG05_11445 [Oerskovia sp. M15]